MNRIPSENQPHPGRPLSDPRLHEQFTEASPSLGPWGLEEQLRQLPHRLTEIPREKLKTFLAGQVESKGCCITPWEYTHWVLTPFRHMSNFHPCYWVIPGCNSKTLRWKLPLDQLKA